MRGTRCPTGGNIRISTSNVTLDARAAAELHLDGKAGDYVCLAIADDGPGMSKEVLSQAMEPFFTTKGPGAGTGLGLSSVATIAKQGGGFALIWSEPQQGCVVSLYLPRSDEASSRAAAAPGELPLGNKELVLLVEDNDQVREVTAKWLLSLNYAVAEARSAAEAIEQLAPQAPARLVLSDVIMPGGLSGYDLARWVASHRRGLQVILCSAYNEGDGRVSSEGASIDAPMLAKPFKKDQLARAVSKALSQGGGANLSSSRPLR